MSEVSNLTQYRLKKRKEWYRRYQGQLDAFLDKFLHSHMEMTYEQISATFQKAQVKNLEASWNYEELREMIEDKMSKVVLEQLYIELDGVRWFDKSLISKEQLLEHCLQLYIRAS